MNQYAYPRRILACILGMGLLAAQAATAQQRLDSTLARDTLLQTTLAAVTVTAFEQQGKLTEQPAAIGYIGAPALRRYAGGDIIGAINAVPGVRMEQRSPGSYRLSIRGSSLRSPFGVRNVKIYYDGIPFTQPGGGTYLNELPPADIGAMEIIRGPAGSLYGAGTGGVLLIHSPLSADTAHQGAGISLEGGSYGFRRAGAFLQWGRSGSASRLQFSSMHSDGYRDHTAMSRQVASLQTTLHRGERLHLEGLLHFTNLRYETPGALTLAQYKADPRAARPAGGGMPSSEESQAAVHQESFLLGLKARYRLSPQLQNTTAVYGAYTDFTNPTIRNYELRQEPHLGGRTVFEYQHQGVAERRFWLGAEMQQGYFSQQDLANHGGQPDTLMTDDRIRNFSVLVFGQAEWAFRKGWGLTAGLSLHHEQLNFTRLYPSPPADYRTDYPPVLSPRLALSKKFRPALMAYAQVSRGFSPPSLGELLPSTTVLNKTLRPEEGLLYELGSKGSLLQGRLYYEACAFVFHLSQSISQRRDSSGADYFVNAGSALQKGVEASLQYTLFASPGSVVRHIRAWTSATYFDFRYQDYRSGDKDYSGHRMPGTAPLTLAAGLDAETRVGLRAHLTMQRTGRVALDDDNSAYAEPYTLLGCVFSYEGRLTQKLGYSVRAGGDNLLNETYSLGNDINAFGGRYYNLAPAINFFARLGLNLSL